MRFSIDWNLSKELQIAGIKMGYGPDDIDIANVLVEPNESLEDAILKSIREDASVGTSHYYAVRYKDQPAVIFYYKNHLPPSEAVLSFIPPTDENGVITDQEITKKILALYDTHEFSRGIRRAGDTTYQGINSEVFSEEMMPLFRIIPLSETDALLYTTEAYEGFTAAELCKPVVYIYDQDPALNRLTVDLPKGGMYTKLIPEFGWDTTWEFQSNPTGNISVDHAHYPYLYYSARVPDYQFLQHGWQVYGKDMVPFFESVLGFIGFTPREQSDFIEFWKDEFDAETLYFVGWKFDEAIDPYATLTFDRKPEAQIRVLLEAFPLKGTPRAQWHYPTVGERLHPHLLRQFERSGTYDVLEWGGVVQKQP